MHNNEWITRTITQHLAFLADADEQAIKTAFRKLARVHHPDVAVEKIGATERFKEINEAYTVLSDPDKRRTYDLFRTRYERYQTTYRAPRPELRVRRQAAGREQSPARPTRRQVPPPPAELRAQVQVPPPPAELRARVQVQPPPARPQGRLQVTLPPARPREQLQAPAQDQLLVRPPAAQPQARLRAQHAVHRAALQTTDPGRAARTRTP